MDELAQRYFKIISRMIDENKTTKELENEEKVQLLGKKQDDES
tara:strand:- start:1038 stop:1166 length:129 start_codon:yes stop_codon:yes gene_type:complete